MPSWYSPDSWCCNECNEDMEQCTAKGRHEEENYWLVKTMAWQDVAQ